MLKLKKEDIILLVKKILICTLGIALLGISGAINIKTRLGADPITVFYEGLSNFLHTNIGMTINVLNAILTLMVFFIKKRYVHLGTLVYVISLGTFVNFGIWAYDLLNIPDIYLVRLIVSVLGCFLAFIGLGIYISIDVGIDPWSAISVIISNKTGKKFAIVRFIQDALTLLFGYLMGGKVGVITLFCVLAGGPLIQKSIEVVDKLVKDMVKSRYED